jgi:hypothetical protein
MKGLHRQGFAFALMSTALLSGCATTKSASGSGNPELLTRDEIMGVEGVNNLYEVIQRLRPRWLTVRAENRSLGGMTTEIAVYQGQTYLGDTETLRQLTPGFAYEIKWMNGTQAMDALPGLGSGRHVAGAIIITTRAPGGSSE